VRGLVRLISTVVLLLILTAVLCKLVPYSAKRQPSSGAAELKVAFIGMTSLQTKEKAHAILSTWGRHIYHDLYFFADYNDESSRIFSVLNFLPEDDGSRLAAQSRQVFGSLHRINLAKYNWFMLFDDDTWVNTNMLYELIRRSDHTQKFGIGFLYNDYEGYPGTSWFSGGGGMLYTRAAYEIILEGFRQGNCVIDSVQDVSMCRCAQKEHVRLLHNPLFNFHRPMSTLWNTNEFYSRHSRYSIASAITFHYVAAKEQKLLQELVAKIDPSEIIL